jgi:hypothetical protein
MARLTLVFSIVVLAVLSTCGLSAQTLTIDKQVIGSAGMVSQTSSSGFELSGIIGQTAIDIVKSTASPYDLHQGFWVPADEDFVGVEENGVVTNNLSNYPNPFASTTTISYYLEFPAVVSVKIYSNTGELVRVIADNFVQYSGEQNLIWDGMDRSGFIAASGSYLYEVSVKPAAGASSGRNFMMRNIMMINR